jgi:hypothetical protein
MRGGTSLLHHLLDSHPRIQLMARELRALRYADLATWAHAAAVHQSFMSTLNRIRHTRFRRQVYRYLRSILRGHGLHELTTVERIHRAFAFALADTDTRYVGDKSPDYVLLYPQFIHRPDARCVFVYRDARDVVADLVLRTTETIGVIARHLELPEEGFDGRLPDPSGIGRFRERLDRNQVHVIERRGGPMMEAWGYATGRD